MKRALAVVPALAILATAACGSSKHAADPSQLSTVASSPAADASSPSAAAASESYGPAASSPTDSPAAAAAGPSVAPLGTAALPGVPAITANATDLTKQPVAAAGTGTASTGLVVRDLVVGSGTAAVASDTVNVRYAGSLYTDGSVFDASWKDNTNPTDPTSFPLSGVVPGFAEGIVGMKPGGRREIVIPPALGYQDQAQASIPANSTLVFIVDLVSTGS